MELLEGKGGSSRIVVVPFYENRNLKTANSNYYYSKERII